MSTGDARLAYIENTIRKHLLKEDRHDRSSEWNKGFNDCCKFILDEIKLHGKRESYLGPTVPKPTDLPPPPPTQKEPVYRFVKHKPILDIELMEFNQAVVKASALAASMPSVVLKYEWDTFNLQEVMREELSKALKRYMGKETCLECKGVTLAFEGLTIFFSRHLSGSCTVHGHVPQNLITDEEVKILNMSNLELAS